MSIPIPTTKSTRLINGAEAEEELGIQNKHAKTRKMVK